MLGETQSGKTTLVNILECALNKARDNELKLRIAQCRKDRLRENAIKDLEEKKREEENPKGKNKSKMKKEAGDGGIDAGGLDSLGGGGDNNKRENKKKGKKNAAKSRQQMWTELYKRSKLSKHEVEALRDELVHRGVECVRLNPKATDLI